MLKKPILLSEAAEIIAPALGQEADYVLGLARRFVREGSIPVADQIGGGVNRRALIDIYGIARLAVGVTLQKASAHLGDLPAAMRQLDKVDDLDRELGQDENFAANFNQIVEEIASDESTDAEWIFDWRLDFTGEHWGSCWRKSPKRTELDMPDIWLLRQSLALNPLLRKVVAAMKERASNA